MIFSTVFIHECTTCINKCKVLIFDFLKSAFLFLHLPKISFRFIWIIQIMFNFFHYLYETYYYAIPQVGDSFFTNIFLLLDRITRKKINLQHYKQSQSNKNVVEYIFPGTFSMRLFFGEKLSKGFTWDFCHFRFNIL